MPTGRCNYPQHHTGPSAGPPIGLVLSIAAGAVIVAEWRTVLIVLAVVAVLAVVGVAVAMLWHSAHAAPYDGAWREVETPAALSAVRPVMAAADRTAALELQVAVLRAQLENRPAEQHLHLHGVTAEDIAAVVTRQQQRALEEDNRHRA